MPSYTKLVADARTVFLTGRTKDLSWRRQQLKSLLRLVDDEKEKLISVLKKDLNKHMLESSLMEVGFVRADVVNALDNLSTWTAKQKVGKTLLTFTDEAYIQCEPLGVVLVMGAWNYPVQLTLAILAGALAAGNCVVVKPSEVAAHTAQLLEEIFPKYFDQECVKLVNGGVQETTDLLKEKFDGIFYTGNSTVGKIILEAAAKHLTPVTLELGGKSPVYVDDTSDFSIVANRILWGRLINSGQTCVAADYVLCTPAVQGRLVESCRQTLKKFYGDDPATSESYGRMINENHFNRVKKLLTSSSGKIAIGGNMDQKTKYIEPTIVSDVKPDDPLMLEEIFGPVLPIVPIKDLDEAIEFINSRDKPLALYIFSKNKGVVQRIISSTSSGGVTVNDTIMHSSVPTLPFGGVGKSGMGASHGKFSFDAFSHQKSCLVRAQAMEKMMDIRYPPYTDFKNSLFEFVLKKNPKSEWNWFYLSLPFVLLGVALGFLLKSGYFG